MDLETRVADGLGFTFENRSDWMAFEEIFVRGFYDRALDHALDGWGGAGEFVALDLGANVGLFALRVLGQFVRRGHDLSRLRLVCVEGSPATWRRLEGRISDWRQVAPGLVGLHGLVGRRSGKARISDEWSHMSRSVGAAGPGSPEVGYLDLETQIGDAAIVHLVKCDIEGAEYDFIDAYEDLLRRCGTLVIELHGDASRREAGERSLRRLGLRSVSQVAQPAALDDDAAVATFVRSAGTAPADPGSPTSGDRATEAPEGTS